VAAQKSHLHLLCGLHVHAPPDACSSSRRACTRSRTCTPFARELANLHASWRTEAEGGARLVAAAAEGACARLVAAAAEGACARLVAAAAEGA
jgi:hypothetical protein